MPDQYLTIKEAAAEIGKAEITIRRFVQKVVKGSDSNRRSLIKPSPEELQELREGPPPAWRISKQLLHEHFDSTEQGSEHATNPTADDASIVSVLKLHNEIMERQLSIKDEQLSVKDEQIKSLTTLVDSLGGQLNERLRESNILMSGFQDRRALPSASASPVIEVPRPGTPKKPKASRATGERVKEPAKPRGWMRRLFGADDKSA